MGTFDILNMRINGYDFHVDLMAGKESWTDPKVKTVFDTGATCCRHQPGALGRTWQEAAQTLAAEEGRHVPAGHLRRPAVHRAGRAATTSTSSRSPRSTPTFGTDAVEAPIDGFMMAKKPKNADGAKELLEYLGTPEAENIYLKTDPTTSAANNGRRHDRLQRAAEEGGRAHRQREEHLAVPGPRHRPDFASTVMIPALQKFIKNPKRHRRHHEEHRAAEEDHLHDHRDWRGTSGLAPRYDPVRSPAGRQAGALTPHHAADAPAESKSSPPARLPTLTRRTRSSCRVMIGIPTLLRVALVWLPALASVGCRSPAGTASGPRRRIQWVGSENYHQIFTIYPPFWPAVQHNLIWLRSCSLIATPLGPVPRGPARPGDAVHPHLPEPVLPAGRAVPRAGRLHLAADLLAGPGPDQRGSTGAQRSTGSATRTSTSGRCWSRRAGGTPAT